MIVPIWSAAFENIGSGDTEYCFTKKLMTDFEKKICTDRTSYYDMIIIFSMLNPNSILMLGESNLICCLTSEGRYECGSVGGKERKIIASIWTTLIKEMSSIVT